MWWSSSVLATVKMFMHTSLLMCITGVATSLIMKNNKLNPMFARSKSVGDMKLGALFEKLLPHNEEDHMSLSDKLLPQEGQMVLGEKPTLLEAEEPAPAPMAAATPTPPIATGMPPPPLPTLHSVGGPLSRLLLPLKYYYNYYNHSDGQPDVSMLNIPVLQQPYENYRIVVAAAPPHLRLGDDRQTVVYVVFPEEQDRGSSEPIAMPNVYFMKKGSGVLDTKIVKNIEKADPLLIVDNNRTVTGINSKQISKHLTFRNKIKFANLIQPI